MAVRRKRIQVGWYCDHTSEKQAPPYKGSHMSHGGRFHKKKGWLETYPQPDTVKSITFTDYHDPKRRPHCPLAVPVYAYVTNLQEGA